MNTAIFRTTPPYPPASFEYPDSWKVVESAGEGYKDVTVMGPRNADDTFSLALAIRFTELPSPRADLKDIADGYIARRSKLQGFVLVSRSRLEINSREAESIEISYLFPKSLDRLDSGTMKICERRILFIRDGSQYEIIYSATESDFLQYGETAQAVIRSLKFG